jgi:hypothetical protein
MKRSRWLLAFAALLALVIALLVAARRTDPLPSPNGYDDFVAAGRMVVGNLGKLSLTNGSQISVFAQLNKDVVERVRRGLRRQSRATLVTGVDRVGKDTESGDLPAVRRASIALKVIALQYASEGRLEEALAIQLDRVRMAVASAHGGVLIDYFRETACELMALHDIERLTNHLNATQCLYTLDILRKTQNDRESLRRIRSRDWQWRWSSFAWLHSWPEIRAQADYVIKGVKNIIGSLSGATQDEAERRALEVAQTHRELSLALARRAFTLEKGRPPANDAELVPEYLPALPPK